MMLSKSTIYSTIIIFCAISLFGCQREKITAGYLIRNVNVIDVKNGILQPNKQVVIEGNAISAIYDKEVTPADSVIIIDGLGKYLIPGLWDMHVHHFNEYEIKGLLFVANGVTGTREMYTWEPNLKIDSLRQLIKEEGNVMPDIHFAGRIIDGPGGKLYKVSNAEEAIKEINRQVEAGVDFFKIYDYLPRDAYFAIAEKSKEHNIPFTGHIPYSVSILEAIEANQKSIEHMGLLLFRCSSQKKEMMKLLKRGRLDSTTGRFAIETFDQELFDSVAVTLAESKTWYCPTIHINYSFTRLKDTVRLMQDTVLKYFPEFYRIQLKRAYGKYFPRYDDAFELMLSALGQLYQEGVKILPGTDTPVGKNNFPGFSLHKELQLLVEAGMKPADALKAATYYPAVYFEKEGEFGEVKEGQLASLVLLDANPIEDIQNTTKIRAVFHRGKYFNREALDSLLLKFKENVTEDYW